MTNNPYKNINTSLFLRASPVCPLDESDNELVHLDCIVISKIQYNPISLLHIWGMLPYRQDLITLSEGETFELYHSRCGDLAMAHVNGIMIHRFTNCRIIERALNNPRSLDNAEIMGVDIILSCDIETPDWQVGK